MSCGIARDKDMKQLNVIRHLGYMKPKYYQVMILSYIYVNLRTFMIH